MSEKKSTAIHWFRQDLRLRDNPALLHAAKADQLIPIFIIDPEDPQIGGASQWWLAKSLEMLNQQLGGDLNIYVGCTEKILKQVIQSNKATLLTWTRRYEPALVTKDKTIKKAIEETNVTVKPFASFLLWEPWEILKNDGGEYRVFTAFYNKCLQSAPPPKPLPLAENLNPLKVSLADFKSITPQDLAPKNWSLTNSAQWFPGEVGARKRLEEFLASKLKTYKYDRDFPGLDHTSHLSPHLHFGEISPRQIWYACQLAREEQAADQGSEHFLKEIVWREFSYHLLYYNPKIPDQNFQLKFNAYPWHTNQKHLMAWQKGKTGIPIVDAGMRELWQSGYMHNRVRMIVASFLCKNLNIDWRAGKDWFFDTLLDADLANNSAGWQWVAGSGADAAPFFRIFNPVTQSTKFDSNGTYIRKWVPELSKLQNKWLHRPWEASTEILSSANIELGKSYPYPLVDLKASRKKALDLFSTL